MAELPPNAPEVIGDRRVWDVIVLGCGPTGLAVAVEARCRGLSVLVLEKKEMMTTIIEKFPVGKPVYMNYLGVGVEFIGNVRFPDELSKDEFISACRGYHRAYGFALHEGEEIISIRKTGGFFECKGKQAYYGRVVMLCIGVFGKPNSLPIAIPPQCKSRVLYDLDDPRKFSSKSILVVGGGDTAAETVEYLKGNNAVAVSYRRAEFLKGERLSQRNYTNLYDAIVKKEIEALLCTNVTSISAAGERVAVELAHDDGRKETREFDVVFLCLGGTPPVQFMKSVGLELDDRSPKLGEGMEAANIPGFYVLGDVAHLKERQGEKVILEKKTIVNSLKHTVYAIEHACRTHLRSKLPTPQVIPKERISPLL